MADISASQTRKESIWTNRLRQTQTALDEVKTQQREASERRRSTRYSSIAANLTGPPQPDPNRTRLPQLHLPMKTQKALLEKYFSRGGVTVANLSLFLNEHRLVLTDAIDLKEFAGEHYEASTIIQPEPLLLLVEALSAAPTNPVTEAYEGSDGHVNLKQPRRSQSDLTEGALQRLRKELSPRRAHHHSSPSTSLSQYGNSRLPPAASVKRSQALVGGLKEPPPGAPKATHVASLYSSRSSMSGDTTSSDSNDSDANDFTPFASQSMSATLAAVANSPTKKVEAQFPRAVILKKVLPAISDPKGAELAVTAFLETVEQYRTAASANAEKGTPDQQIKRKDGTKLGGTVLALMAADKVSGNGSSPSNSPVQKAKAFSENDAMEALRHFLKPISESDSKVVASAFKVLLGTSAKSGTANLSPGKEDEEDFQAKLQQYGHLLAVNDELELLPVSRERIADVCDLHELSQGTASALMARLDHMSLGVVHFGTFESELLADIAALKQLPTACLLSKGHMHVVAELVAHTYPFCIEQLMGRKALDALLGSNAVEPYEPYTMGGFFYNSKQADPVIPKLGQRNLFGTSTINNSMSSQQEDSIRLRDKGKGDEEVGDSHTAHINAAEALLRKYLLESADGHFSVKMKRQLYLSTLPKYMLPRIDDDEQTLRRMERVHYRRQRVLRKRDGLGAMMLPIDMMEGSLMSQSNRPKGNQRGGSASATTKHGTTTEPTISAMSTYRSHSNDGKGGATALYVARTTSVSSTSPRPMSTLSTPRPCTAREWTSVIQKGRGQERPEPVTATFTIQRRIPAPPSKWGNVTQFAKKDDEETMDRAHGGILMEPTRPSVEEAPHRPQTSDEAYNSRAFRLYTLDGATYPLYKKDGTVVGESEYTSSRRLDTKRTATEEVAEAESAIPDATVEHSSTPQKRSMSADSKKSTPKSASARRYLPRPPQKANKRSHTSANHASDGFDTLVKEMLSANGISTVI